MSTKSFTINLPIITGDQDRRRLQKSFSFGCNLQNAVMGGGWDRVLKMRATAEWQTARAMPKSSERTKAFRDLRVHFRLSEYDFHADVAMHRKASGRGHLLGINECQKHLSSGTTNRLEERGWPHSSIRMNSEASCGCFCEEQEQPSTVGG